MNLFETISFEKTEFPEAFQYLFHEQVIYILKNGPLKHWFKKKKVFILCVFADTLAILFFFLLG